MCIKDFDFIKFIMISLMAELWKCIALGNPTSTVLVKQHLKEEINQYYPRLEILLRGTSVVVMVLTWYENRTLQLWNFVFKVILIRARLEKSRESGFERQSQRIENNDTRQGK